jgi:PBSX family phage portal protein
MSKVSAKVISLSKSDSNALQNVEGDERGFENTSALVPPYDPEALITVMEHSDSLRTCIDAYLTNIDSYGHRFEPVIDLEADDAEEVIRVSMMLGQERTAELEDGDKFEFKEPTDEEIEERMEEIRMDALIEKAKAASWFEECVQDISFVELRRRTRMELEITGNAYWEVIRDESGNIVELTPLASFTMRLLAKDKTPTDIKVPYRTPDLEIDYRDRSYRFRRYVQSYSGEYVYFKEFRDPRVISSKTGNAFASDADMQSKEYTGQDDIIPATEVIHFKVYSPRSSYGVPRWIGSLLAILGNRKASEVNLAYFDNKSVPPLALLVSGGSLNDESVNRIESYVEEELKGSENFHKILVIEAEKQEGGTAFDAGGTMKVEIVPLTSAQLKDAQFLEYMERNTDETGMSFRLPRLLRGDIRDFNRGTAEAALNFSEAQVFEPERNNFDHLIDTKLMLDLKFRYWRFKSNSPVRVNPETLAEMIQSLGDVLPVGVALDLAEEVFGRNFSDVTADWAKRPLKLTLAGLNKGHTTLDDVEIEGEKEEDGWVKPNEDGSLPGGGEGEPGGAGHLSPAEEGQLEREVASLVAQPKSWKKLSGEVKRLLRLRAQLMSKEAREYERTIMKPENTNDNHSS